MRKQRPYCLHCQREVENIKVGDTVIYVARKSRTHFKARVLGVAFMESFGERYLYSTIEFHDGHGSPVRLTFVPVLTRYHRAGIMPTHKLTHPHTDE